MIIFVPDAVSQCKSTYPYLLASYFFFRFPLLDSFRLRVIAKLHELRNENMVAHGRNLLFMNLQMTQQEMQLLYHAEAPITSSKRIRISRNARTRIDPRAPPLIK